MKWTVQHASYDPKGGEGILHVGRGTKGIFEIFEDGPHFLLHAPRSMRIPADLFDTLQDAKDKALSIDLANPRSG